MTLLSLRSSIMLLETEFEFNIKSFISHRNKLFVVRIDIICIVIRKIGTIFWYPLWWGNWFTTISVQFWWWKMFCPSFLIFLFFLSQNYAWPPRSGRSKHTNLFVHFKFFLTAMLDIMYKISTDICCCPWEASTFSAKNVERWRGTVIKFTYMIWLRTHH